MSTPPLKFRLWNSQRGLCWICLKPMNQKPDDPACATIDHLVPLGRSGGNRPGNKLLAHQHCNQLRRDRPVKGVKLKLLRERAISRIVEASRRMGSRVQRTKD